MRILLSGTPAFGHLLPFAALARAARAAGHEVALLTSGGMTGAVDPELPVLAAGPMADVLFAEVAARTGGGNPSTDPKPETVAEFFAGTRVDLSIDEALTVAEPWRPDLIVAEACDFVGPLVAAALGVPCGLLAFGPAVPDEFVRPMFALVASRYAERGLTPVPPAVFLDPCPPSLQVPGWQAPPNRIALRPEPHHVEGLSWTVPEFPGRADRPLVLVTLGTVFSEFDVLQQILASIKDLDVNVIATLGPLADTDAVDVDPSWVRTVGFVPLDQLLTPATAVVCSGGAGTVLATLSRGLPMVIMPQGADQFINAGRAEASGAAAVVPAPDQVGVALAKVLGENNFRDRAEVLAEEIADLEPAARVVARLAEQFGRD
ncbi:MAG TPA: glycosyltransferase [Pseudonocardiaceae bacterium]|jgi:UDP:flavonoid glycosyltransferase YjiC (YdhE family)|nr:glycosyltransferase [Pseudonocardiaceae bacterium]